METVRFDTLKAFEKLVGAGMPAEQAKVYVEILADMMLNRAETFDTLKAFEKLVSAGMPPEQAKVNVEVFAEIMSNRAERFAEMLATTAISIPIGATNSQL